MAKDSVKKRKQDLGIFYTPQEVVEFIYEILSIWKNKDAKENHRWQYKKPKPHYPSVIDPACGEGIFLKKAVDGGFTTPNYIWGVDLDKKVKDEWKKITLLKSFGSKANLDFHFYHQDGLLPIPEKRVGHKKGGMNQYDVAVGNPPYGGMGIGEITKELEESLFEYEIWKKAVQKQSKEITTQLGLMENLIKKRDKERLTKFPIEILFLDRFIQLAKPGGWIAIIIPDGILTNSNSHYVREFLSERTKIEAIISLPRETFKNVGTNAKTSILFLRKLKEKEKPEQDYKVFLASVEKINQDNFDTIVKSYEKLYNLGENLMNDSDSVQITKDQTGREVVMLRTDKTLKQLMEEKPSSRWDANYWQPKYEKLMQKLGLSGFKSVTGKQVMESMTNGNRDREWAGKEDEKVRFIQVVNVLNTGVDFEAGAINKHYARKNGLGDPDRSRLKGGDILLISGATGSIGRICIIEEVFEPTNVSQDINVIRLYKNSEINKYFFTIFLLSSFGNGQLERFSKGVSGQVKVTFDHIQSIKIPVLPNSIQTNIKNNYEEITKLHNQAMVAKKSKNETEYKNNLATAEKMLKDLTAKTEEVIRGERDDVN